MNQPHRFVATVRVLEGDVSGSVIHTKTRIFNGTDNINDIYKWYLKITHSPLNQGTPVLHGDLVISPGGKNDD